MNLPPSNLLDVRWKRLILGEHKGLSVLFMYDALTRWFRRRSCSRREDVNRDDFCPVTQRRTPVGGHWKWVTGHLVVRRHRGQTLTVQHLQSTCSKEAKIKSPHLVCGPPSTLRNYRRTIRSRQQQPGGDDVT